MGNGLRRQARILWRFRFHLLCAAAALVLWETPWIKPFRVFVVMVHEMCHAVAALVTGGEVLEMRTAWAEHGYTLSRGGWPLIIVSAGYVGSALLGAGLIWSGVLPQLQRLALLLDHRQKAVPQDLQPGFGDRHGAGSSFRVSQIWPRLTTRVEPCCVSRNSTIQLRSSRPTGRIRKADMLYPAG